MNQNETDNSKWCENVIIADGDYIDKVAFDLTVNFERMIGRRIPKADMAQWTDCIALDGGLREGGHHTQVIILHNGNKQQLDYFTPSNYSAELNQQAYNSRLGEFAFSALSVEETLTSKEDFFLEVLNIACSKEEVKRIMIVPNAEEYYDSVRGALKSVDKESKRITVFAMQPMPGTGFQQEILGYSLMAALGIRSSEIK